MFNVCLKIFICRYSGLLILVEVKIGVKSVREFFFMHKNEVIKSNRENLDTKNKWLRVKFIFKFLNFIRHGIY
jgi:hypothetical protein